MIMVKKKKKVFEPEAAAGAEAVEPEVVAETNPADEIAELNDKLLRLRAEYDNFRKRSYKDIALATSSARIATMEPVLRVFDHFAMAVEAAGGAENMDAIRQGMEMIFNEFQKALDEWGLIPVDAVGERFDPNLHEAVAHEASEDKPEGVVTKQWRRGYRLGERLIRPATVVVSSGPAGE